MPSGFVINETTLNDKLRALRTADYRESKFGIGGESLLEILGYTGRAYPGLSDALLIKLVRDFIGYNASADVLLMAFGLLRGCEAVSIGKRRELYLKKSNYLELFHKDDNAEYKKLTSADKRSEQLKLFAQRLAKKEESYINELSSAIVRTFTTAEALAKYIGNVDSYAKKKLDKNGKMLCYEPILQTPSYLKIPVDIDAADVAAPIIEHVSGELKGLVRRLEEAYSAPQVKKKATKAAVLPVKTVVLPAEAGMSPTESGKEGVYPVTKTLESLANAKRLPKKSYMALWGPWRDTFTQDNLPDYPVFNSRTDNKVLGVGRNFVYVAEAGANGAFAKEVHVEPGKEYEVCIGFNNNGSPDLNSTGATIAQQVRLATIFPKEVPPDKDCIVYAIISASNTRPLQIWDGATFVSSQIVTLRYKRGSAKIKVSGNANGRVLSENLFSNEGVYLGWHELDGLVPAGDSASGCVIYRLVAE